MNNPQEPLEREIPYILARGADGVEITIEKERSYFAECESLSPDLSKHLVVGHTRDDLPIASAEEAVRKAGVAELSEAIRVLHQKGIRTVTIHPSRGDAGVSFEELRALNLRSIEELSDVAIGLGMQLLLENQPPFETAEKIYDVLTALRGKTFLTIDLAHAHCYGPPNNVDRFLELNSKFICHVHLSDNRGERDEHLFPSYGTVDFQGAIRKLIRLTEGRPLNFSLESFREVSSNGTIRSLTLEERVPFVTEAVRFVRDIIEGA